jgi:protein-tyrosine phosphatase
MIDLHSHILPGIDDGASDLGMAIAMARAYVADGVTTLACTPHILPGLYHNAGPQIRLAVRQLQGELDQRGIALQLVTGADIHIVPDFVAGLQSGRLLSLADSRYVLVEPPHHAAPPRLGDLLFQLVSAGYVPILTHPERLTWIKTHYSAIQGFVKSGVWLQVTAGSLAGNFGRAAQYWAERLLDEGYVHILAADAHDMDRRPPNLGLGRQLAAKRTSEQEAEHLVATRPLAIVQNIVHDKWPFALPKPAAAALFAEVADASADSNAKARIGPGRGAGDGGGGFAERLRRFFE